MIEPMEEMPEEEGMEEEASKPDPQALLEQGRQLCGIGESLISAAKAMGAEDSSEEEEYSEEEESTDDSPGDGYDDSSDSAEPLSSSKGNPKKMAIILAIKRRLGKK